MRKIVAGLHMSLDSVVQSPDTTVFPYNYANDEMMQAIGSAMATTDAMLLGRVTYQEFAAHWPSQSGDIAHYMNETPKLVVSTTLHRIDWRNSTLIGGSGGRLFEGGGPPVPLKLEDAQTFRTGDQWLTYTPADR